MNTIRTASFALSLACMAALSACQRQAEPAEAESARSTMIGRAMEKAAAEAREKLATENISLGPGGDGIHIGKQDDSLPKAEITPTGDLLIAGKPVAIDAEQRALLMDYRKHVAGIAEAGILVGAQGVDLAGEAVSAAIKGVFSGNTDDVEKRMEAEGEKIKVSARKICAYLPAMLATQQKLAASLPEFKPYANMDQDDVDDCMSDHDESHAAGERVGQAVGKAVHGDSDDTNRNAAEEAEAASAEGSDKQ